jgi:predicted nucleic acid-binding protein
MALPKAEGGTSPIPSRTFEPFGTNGRSAPVSESTASIRELLTRHALVAVDSNVLIYLITGDPARAEAAASIVNAVAAGRTGGVLSSAGLSEVLVGPARNNDGASFERIAATIRDLGFRIVPLDARAAEDAAWIRGRTGMSLPDSIHIACARAAGATVFVTNDRGIGSGQGLEVRYLDDLVA